MKPQKDDVNAVSVDFLPDADEIERKPLPRYLQSTIHLLLGGFVVFLVWASFSEVDRVVLAQGQLVNPTPNIVVQPLETSIIRSIDVRVGQVVRKGEVLARLDPTFAQADESQLRTRLRSLNTQTQVLADELAGSSRRSVPSDADGQLQAQLSLERRANYDAQLKRINDNLERLAAAMATNRKDQEVLSRRLKSLTEIENMQESLLAQQFGARLQLLEARDRRLAVERDLQAVTNKEAELAREIASLQSEKTAFTKSWRQKAMEDLLTATRERDAVKEQLQKADKIKQLIELVAPADGVVLEVAKLSAGSVIKGAEPFFTLVPLDAQLEAELKIDSMDIGYIKLGDKTNIKIDAFPYQRHGYLEGKVRTISQDSFQRDFNSPGQGSTTYYKSRIQIGEKKLEKMSDKSTLLPGMSLSGEIVVGKRTVISYLLWPLTKTLDEAIREP